MIKVTKNDYGKAIARITQTRSRLQTIPSLWTTKAIANLERHLLHHLETQGRGGPPPPLSDATRKIYRARGTPNGEGIRNHLEISYHAVGNKSLAILGIPQGKPSMIAKVQERGAVIRVTPKMRGYLATLGIYLKADTEQIVIPARRFWSTGNERARTEAKAMLKKLLDI